MRQVKEKISVIVPAFNEEAFIRPSLEEIVATFDAMDLDYEVIVINDGSRDGTLREALEAARRHPRIKVKRNLENYGKGRALKKAFRYCDGELIVFLDADLDLEPSFVPILIDILKWEAVDVVIGSKFHPMSQIEYSLQRRFISFIYYFVIKLLFKLRLRDTQTGIKVFRRQVLEEVFPGILVKKFAFDLELLAVAQRLGFKIAEAPIVLKQRRRYGRIGARALWQTGWDTLAVFYRLYILRYYDKISVKKTRERDAKEFSHEEEFVPKGPGVS